MKPSPVKLLRRQETTASLIGKEGIVLQWTIVRVAPKSFEQEAPYPVVIVQFADEQKIIGQLVDWQEKDLVQGRKVVAVLRKLHPEDTESVIQYSIKFKPL